MLPIMPGKPPLKVVLPPMLGLPAKAPGLTPPPPKPKKLAAAKADRTGETQRADSSRACRMWEMAATEELAAPLLLLDILVFLLWRLLETPSWGSFFSSSRQPILVAAAIAAAAAGGEAVSDSAAESRGEDRRRGMTLCI